MRHIFEFVMSSLGIPLFSLIYVIYDYRNYFFSFKMTEMRTWQESGMNIDRYLLRRIDKLLVEVADLRVTRLSYPNCLFEYFYI
jgi:hypothetical protein